MDRRLTALTVIIAVLVLVNAYFFISVLGAPAEAPGPIFNTAQAFIAPPNQVSYLPILDTSMSEVKLDAKAAIVYDVKADRNLFERNIKEQLPVASLTKILNTIVVWERFSPSAEVVVQASAVKVDGERQDLYENEHLSVSDLVQLMLIESSNDAAYALRDYAASQQVDLIKEMNLKALALGMRDTQFVDAAGLNDSGYSTAADLVKAVRYALRYDALWRFSREATATVTSSDGKFSHDIKSTNQLLGVVTDIVGGKTGYTDSALGCMILIVDTGKDDKLIAVVLGSHSRFEDMKNLISWSKRAYHW
jgi:D-alanyl-D-alanine carboxypeptidase